MDQLIIKKLSNSTSSLLAMILFKFSAAIVFTYKNLSTLRIDSRLLLTLSGDILLHLVYNYQTHLECFQYNCKGE